MNDEIREFLLILPITALTLVAILVKYIIELIESDE